MTASGRGRPATAGPADDGMVTAELAVALPALVVVALVALFGVGVTTAKLECTDAAAVAARLAARGETAAVVRSTALEAAPRGAGLVVTTSSTTVTAVVRDRVRPPGLGRLLPAVTVSARVVAAPEPQPGAAP